MRTALVSLVAAGLVASAAAQDAPAPEGFVLVAGGAFKHPQSRFFGKGLTVADFYLGRYEVTQREWTAVMGHNPSEFKGDDLPVEMVSWYDCVEYCNKRSEKEGLQPCYTIDKATPDPQNQNEVDDHKWTVTVNAGANGYRLPTEIEWEYAASGGQRSAGFTYCGGNDVNQVAWFWQNSGNEYLQGLWNWPAIERNGNRTHPVGSRAPNELGLHDMSGNVREWCWDWYVDLEVEGVPAGLVRTWKGGGWMGGDFCCEPRHRGPFEPNSRGYDHGFRVCRGK
jgi:formylglycine-generating enzyme required for sulfatase activity